MEHTLGSTQHGRMVALQENDLTIRFVSYDEADTVYVNVYKGSSRVDTMHTDKNQLEKAMSILFPSGFGGRKNNGF